MRKTGKERQAKWRAAHKAESRRRRRQWYHNSKHKPGFKTAEKISSKRKQLRSRYNLSLADWYTLFIKQGCLCAVCRSPAPRGKNWHTDHDHATGKVRGILCHPCNVSLGLMQDDPYYVRKLAAYLEGFHAQS